MAFRHTVSTGAGIRRAGDPVIAIAVVLALAAAQRGAEHGRATSGYEALAGA